MNLDRINVAELVVAIMSLPEEDIQYVRSHIDERYGVPFKFTTECAGGCDNGIYTFKEDYSTLYKKGDRKICSICHGNLTKL